MVPEPAFAIGERQIGRDHPPYIIAELSANHCQDLELARAIVRDCAAAGVDAVKLQTYTPDTMTMDVDLPSYQIEGGAWSGESLYRLYQRAMTPWKWTEELLALARDCGVHLFSTPFDLTAVDFLENLGVPAYKIASFELTYHQLLARVAETGKPIIMSTGLATKNEIEAAVGVLRTNGATQISLLKCTSAYPARNLDLNLSLIPQMQNDFGVPIGYSDHTLGTTASIAAVALGASIVEKHVKDASSSYSADESFSALSRDLHQMVIACREAYESRGTPRYGPTNSEIPSLHFRRSVIATREIKPGEMITANDVAILRPMIGASPGELDLIVGRPSPCHLQRGEGVPSPHE